MTLKDIIYPVFLPHAGCPFQCVYCNQHVVTKAQGADPTDEGLIMDAEGRLEQAAEDAKRTGIQGEVAFYGGTFTVLPSGMLLRLLELASRFCAEGVFTGIRFSTRPDAISPDICSLLRDYPISTVELGVQSLSDQVLNQSRRGYDAHTVNNAVVLVQSEGWSLGIQLMMGLPGDTQELFYRSISGVIDLKPDFVRIYPTLVLKDTPLAQWFRQGYYRPLSLIEAIQWCLPAYDRFLQAGIPVARLGLHSDPELEKPGAIVAGPYHPAFGYLVRVHWWRSRIDQSLTHEVLDRSGTDKQLLILVPERSVSEVIGPRRINILYWKKKWRLNHVFVEGRANITYGMFEWRCN